ncbi:MAG: hypothetical protein Q9195_002757 [Heterodermia aff. obscurata]
MASTLSKPPPHTRQSSRPESASSSSIITVKRAASLTSRNGSHPPISGLRTQSPNDTVVIPTTFSARTLSPDPNRRASAVYPRSDSGNGVREGVGNLNRWSQSTVSSKSSSTHNRRSSFSKRLSGSFGSFGGLGSAQQSPSPNAKGTPKGRPSPKGSPEGPFKKTPPGQPPPILPPIVTLTSLSQAVDAADTPSTIATITPATADLIPPDTHAPSEPDYFGDRWKTRSPSKSRNAVPRTAAASPLIPKPESPKRVQFESSKPQRLAAAEPAVSLYSERGASRGGSKARRRSSRSGHSRNREDSSRGSGGTEAESSASSVRSNRRREHRRKTPSQKAMLSKALQKANHAVLLDNAQNFEGAMGAYADACALLQQVMQRSSGDDDRKKLEAVRNTYTNRINELRNTGSTYQSSDGKALPDKPRDRDSTDSKNQEPLSPLTDEEEDSVYVSTATAARIDSDRPHFAASKYAPANLPVQLPPRRQSLQQSAFADTRTSSFSNTPHGPQLDPYGKSPPRDRMVETSMTLEPPLSQHYMPPPLSPRRPSSPAPPPKDDSQPSVVPVLKSETNAGYHMRQDTAESTSWLDTIDESGGSTSSSVHSRSSSIGLRRKRIRAASGATEAEFDAALDAAVEAAYDDGLEPAEDDNHGNLAKAPEQEYAQQPFKYDPSSGVRKNVEMAKEKVREAEREAAVALAKDHEKRRLQDSAYSRDSIDLEYGDDDADEEERMLYELSRDYVMDDGEYDIQTKSALPRQSDSSGFSGRTWGSIGSNPTSAGTSLSTVAEMPSLNTKLQPKMLPPPMHPPPLGALPPPPQSAITTSMPSSGPLARPPSLITSPGVRDRRLSGLKVKQLKIETNTKAPAAPETAAPNLEPSSEPSLTTQPLPDPPRSAVTMSQSQVTLPSLAFKSSTSSINQTVSRKGSSPLPTPSPAEGTPSTIPATPALTKVTSADSFESIPAIPDSPGRFNVKSSMGTKGLKKNFSSSSLKNKILSVSVPDPAEVSPNPPESISSNPRRNLSMAAPMPIPTASAFIVDGHLFGSDIHSPTSPGSPNLQVANAPLPLEPCPESSLLRPFWFLRCIYQTIAHPRGGYISNKLFVPRDIWKVRTTKLKSIEEKVSSCDLLTATLLKLAKVDTMNVDSILQEMRFLEMVIEQVRGSLSKKLGGEVGTVGAPWLSKGASLDDMNATSDALSSKSNNMSTKSYLSSLKKFSRSKNSAGPGYSAAAAVVPSSKDGYKEVPALKSLPMTNTDHPRFAKRDVNHVQYGGPNANYMAALAKLCDAAQILDQIARQIEDPGLKHSSRAHVGLEFSIHNAAEFFGFYICRFVINDVGIMLDKFIKRGTEWVAS